MATPAPPTTRHQAQKQAANAVPVRFPLRDRVYELAADVGRLRRRTEPETYTRHLVDRIAGYTQDLYLLVTPSAAELAAWTAPGDEDAITEAIKVVDQEWARLQQLLGVRA